MRLDAFFNDNPDWRKFADLVVYPPTQEEMTKEFVGVDPEALSRSGELVREGGGYVTRGAIYTRVRREERLSEGHHTADRWAAMLSLQAPPGIKTDNTFWAGRKSFAEVFGEEYANNVKKQLAKQGVNLKPGDEYMPELARRRFDPEAVVPFSGAREYMKKLCQRRGWGINGAVSVAHRQSDTDQTQIIPLGEDIIRRKAVTMVRKNPELRKLTKTELRAMVIEKHGPSKTVARDSLNIPK